MTVLDCFDLPLGLHSNRLLQIRFLAFVMLASLFVPVLSVLPMLFLLLPISESVAMLLSVLLNILLFFQLQHSHFPHVRFALFRNSFFQIVNPHRQVLPLTVLDCFDLPLGLHSNRLLQIRFLDFSMLFDCLKIHLLLLFLPLIPEPVATAYLVLLNLLLLALCFLFVLEHK